MFLRPDPAIGVAGRLRPEGGAGDNRYRTWFRGRDALYAPDAAAMMCGHAVQDHVLHGWMPDAPRIGRDTRVTAFGSCFAANISRWLALRDYRVAGATAFGSTGASAAPALPRTGRKAGRAGASPHVVRIGEGMVNSFVILRQFEWAWEGRALEDPLWDGATDPRSKDDDAARCAARAVFDETDVFILTLGLSEVWYDRPTGEVFRRTMPKAAYDPARHGFRVSSVEENRRNLEAIYRLIRKHRPDATVIVTLSPVPLIATFRDTNCITSNSASKAILRAALDEVLRAHHRDGHLFYWPSYEIVTDVFGSPFKADRRHLPRPVLDFIMIQFEHVWCRADAAAELPTLDESYVQALAASRMLPRALGRAVRRRNRDVLERHALNDGLDDDDAVTAAMQRLISRVLAGWDAEDCRKTSHG